MYIYYFLLLYNCQEKKLYLNKLLSIYYVFHRKIGCARHAELDSVSNITICSVPTVML